MVNDLIQAQSSFEKQKGNQTNISGDSFFAKLDSLRNDFKKLPGCEKLKIAMERYNIEITKNYNVINSDTQTLYSSDMFFVIAGETQICSASKSTIGLIYSGKQLGKDLRKWKKFYECNK